MVIIYNLLIKAFLSVYCFKIIELVEKRGSFIRKDYLVGLKQLVESYGALDFPSYCNSRLPRGS